jgi:hypothetical protein
MKYVNAVVVVIVVFLPFLSSAADKAATKPPELKTSQGSANLHRRST